MPFATLNGHALLSGVVCLPRTGAWHADLVVDAETSDGLDGALTLVLGALTLKGTARRAGAFVQTAHVRLVGGAGGLPTQLPAKAYRSPTVGIILQDLSTDSGEAFAATIAADVRASTMPAWVRTQGATAAALDALASSLGMIWRVQLDGALWLGNELWPVAAAQTYDVLEERPERAFAELGTDSPALLPGTVLAGRRVSYVEHAFDSRSIRTRYWWEP